MFHPDLLCDQTIVVTGGGTGLGRAMSECFANHGARVGMIGRREAPLQETAAAITKRGNTAAWAIADVRDPAAVSDAIDRLEAELEPVTAVVNNAAGNFLAASEDLSANAFDAVVRIVLYGTFHVTQELGRRWIERQCGGHVLSIATTYAWTGSPFVLPSACAKAGVLAMTKSLAVEWATYKIRLNAIAPGPFATEGAFSRLMPAEMQERARKGHPMGRFGEPGELADLAAFMLSPMASYMNGECVVLDGGEHLKGGQEFGKLTDLPRDQVKEVMRKLRPSKG